MVSGLKTTNKKDFIGGESSKSKKPLSDWNFHETKICNPICPTLPIPETQVVRLIQVVATQKISYFIFKYFLKFNYIYKIRFV